MWLYSILVAIDVLLAGAIIGLVLMQQGKGADVGAAFGSGASGTVFGARGSASFLSRATAVLAVLFFANSLLLAYLASNRPVTESVISQDVVIEDMIDVPSASARDEDLSEPLFPGEEADLPVSSLPGEESDLPELPDTYDSGTVDSGLPETDFPGN